jgi:hypothetical protein
LANSSLKWSRLCGVVAVAVIIFASLMLPPGWERLRTGHWAIEHFLAFFAATSIVCLGWRQPFVVAGLLMPFAALLEAVQYWTPNHSPNLLAALSGAGGALAAALLAEFILRVRNHRPLRQAGGESQVPALIPD